MILVTTNDVPGRRIERACGLVRGNSIRARSVFSDVKAGLRVVVGGEIPEYTKMLAETREQALDRLIAEAEALGANAIVGLRFVTAQTMLGAAELLAYGTAVRLADRGDD